MTDSPTKKGGTQFRPPFRTANIWTSRGAFWTEVLGTAQQRTGAKDVEPVPVALAVGIEEVQGMPGKSSILSRDLIDFNICHDILMGIL